MASKRKRVTTPRDDLSSPSKWRLQHGPVTAPERGDDPETGVPFQRRRAVDTLGMLLENGSITQQMHDAGGYFRALFRSAALNGIATSQLIRLAGATADEMSGRQIDARRRVANAIDALGGHDSPAGSCAWFVVGLEFSVREWAMRQGWSGRLVHGPVAQGILVAALGTLAMHFRLTPRQRAA
jgi:hypothetical protein